MKNKYIRLTREQISEILEKFSDNKLIHDRGPCGDWTTHFAENDILEFINNNEFVIPIEDYQVFEK